MNTTPITVRITAEDGARIRAEAKRQRMEMALVAAIDRNLRSIADQLLASLEKMGYPVAALQCETRKKLATLHRQGRNAQFKRAARAS